MFGLDYHTYTGRTDPFIDGVGYLACHTFLYLRSPGNYLDNPGDLAGAYNPPLFIGNVSYISRPKKRKQVMAR